MKRCMPYDPDRLHQTVVPPGQDAHPPRGDLDPGPLGNQRRGMGPADCGGCWPSGGCWAAISARIVNDYGNSPGSAASTQSTMWPARLSEPDHRIFPPHRSRHPSPIGLHLSWTRTRKPSAPADRTAQLAPGIISTAEQLGQPSLTCRDFTLTTRPPNKARPAHPDHHEKCLSFSSFSSSWTYPSFPLPRSRCRPGSLILPIRQ